MVMKTKICPLCGNEIPLKENICRYCLKDITEGEYLTKNCGTYSYQLKKLPSAMNSAQANYTYSNVLPIRRWLALMIFTLGLYRYYWFYKNSKLIGQKHPVLRTIGFIIPIVNWFMYYPLLRDMKKVIKSEGLESFNVPLNFLLYFFVPIFNYWSMINVQENMNEFWRKVQGLKERREFTNTEKVAIVVLSLIYLLLFICVINLLMMFI